MPMMKYWWLCGVLIAMARGWVPPSHRAPPRVVLRASAAATQLTQLKKLVERAALTRSKSWSSAARSQHGLHIYDGVGHARLPTMRAAPPATPPAAADANT